MSKLRLNHAKQAFGIVEISLLFSIVTVLMVGYMAWVTNPAINDGTKAIITRKKMDEITAAIQRFRLENNRLPCPANPSMAQNSYGTYIFDDEALVYTMYGAECQPKGNTIPAGAVPTRALGLPSSYQLDAWGRRFLYQVSAAVCNNSKNFFASSKNCSTATYNNIYNGGDITILSAASGGTTYSSSAAYVLLSAGADGNGAYLPSGSSIACSSSNADEKENCNGDTIFVSRAMYAGFDNIVMFRNKTQLDNLVYDPVTFPISRTMCASNSTSLGTITNTVANSLNSAFTGNSINTDQAGSNAVLDLMWVLQEACFEAYSYDPNCGSSPTQLYTPAPSCIAKYCPGGGQYDSYTNTCTCSNTGWSGSGC